MKQRTKNWFRAGFSMQQYCEVIEECGALAEYSISKYQGKDIKTCKIHYLMAKEKLEMNQ